MADGRRSLRAAAFVLLLALAGCSSLIPKYSRPAAPVPATYGAELTPASGEAAADVEWQRFFIDDRLKRLIGIALTSNRDLRIAVLNIEQARASYQVHRAALYPAIGLGASATRQPDAFGHLEQVYAAGLVVSSYEIDLFGRVHDLSEAALAQYLATAEARKAVQISLIASVATTYLSVAADDELLKVTQQTLATREESTRLTKLRFDNGASSELDYRQAESLLEGARATLAATVRARALDENALTLLLGQTPPEQPAAVPLAGAHMLAAPPAGLPSDLLVRRPDIRSAEQQLLAANANIGAARAAFLPHITLTTSAGTASTQLSGLFKNGSFAITGAVQLLQPIFDFGLNQANLDIAQVDRDIAIAQYEKTIQTAFREVSDALAGRATLGEQLRAQAAQTNALEIAFRLADLRYRAGASSYLDSLEAQRALFVAQQLLVQAQATQLQNDVALYRALGGGWKDETAETASLTPPS
jgi:outer membrane protein, multidrug efflux system